MIILFMTKLTVWKFPLHQHKQRLMLPNGSKILSVAMQHGVPMLWALVNPEQDKQTEIHVFTRATGQEFDAEPDTAINFHFIGTVLDGPYVWHFFYKHISGTLML